MVAGWLKGMGEDDEILNKNEIDWEIVDSNYSLLFFFF